MRNQILALLNLVLIVACQATEEHAKVESYSLELVGDKRFNLDFETNKYGHIQYWEEGGNAQLIFGNPETNQLKFYDYSNGQLLKTISFPRDLEGPDRFLVGYFQSFFVLNPDSIVSVIDQAKEFILADGKGDILQRIRFEGGEDSWDLYPGIHDFYPPARVVNKLYFHQGWGASDKQNLIFEWDLEAEPSMAISTQMAWPDILDKAWKSSNVYHWKNYPFVYNPDEHAFIFSFNASQDLMITHDFENLICHNAASKFIKEIPTLDSRLNGDPSKLFADYNQRSFYRSLMYDPYRKHYYRFASIAIRPPLESDENTNRRFAEMSIIVLDKDFNILTEQRFSSTKVYLEKTAFINEDGLHMAYLPGESEPDEEEVIIFDLFRLLKQ